MAADATKVSALHVPHPQRLANTCTAKAAAYGVTREIGTAIPYDLTQHWAATFHALGWGGIRYLPRFSTGSRDVAYAVFGDAGELTWPEDPIPTPGRAAAAAVGIRVIDPPLRITITPTPTIP